MATVGSTAPVDCGYVPLVQIWRGDLVESIHHGAVAVVDSSGGSIAAIGDPRCVTFLRSAAKPAQVLPLIASGAVKRFGFNAAEIAIMTGSHGGEPFHLKTVRSILNKIGLDSSALQCGVQEPMHRPTARAMTAAGEIPTPLHNNCSGKHAGILALAVHRGDPIDSYLDPAHPVQAGIRKVIEELAGIEAGEIATALDGCSAPTFAMSLRQAALLYARLADPGEGGGAHRVAASRALEAMRAHPEMVAGTDRMETLLMQTGHHRVVAKIGAEGFYALALEIHGRGVGVALKIADGNEKRSRDCAVLECLRQIDAIPPEAAARLESRFAGAILNHRGMKVGRIVADFRMARGARAEAAAPPGGRWNRRVL